MVIFVVIMGFFETEFLKAINRLKCPRYISVGHADFELISMHLPVPPEFCD